MTPDQFSFTCLICPNGCGLSVIEEKGIFLVRGNRCPRGVRFVRQEFRKKGRRGDFQSEKPFLHYSGEELSSILTLWDLKLEGVDEDHFIQGSPERSLYRNLVYAQGQSLILEQIDPDMAEKHENTAQRLVKMQKNGLPVSPFLSGKNGKFIQNHDGRVWQLTPFVQGKSLNRRSYWQDEWRGQALGEFLCRLYETEKPDPEAPLFDLIGFINLLVEQISLNRTDLLPRLIPFLNKLEKSVFPLYDKMPRVFGHGDPHPLNIIWGDNKILTLIDWEFCGTKPLLYDASLIMGCVGSESPHSFDGPFNRTFYQCLQKSKIFPSLWLNHLPSFILAQRFAWLNEWLRHKDESMIEQEISYMEMLL
jgi:homoserine kinase type II